jgi:hypothetical protein
MVTGKSARCARSLSITITIVVIDITGEPDDEVIR